MIAMRHSARSLIFLALLATAVSQDCGDVDSSLEAQLHKKILCKYDSSNRPVKDHKTAVNVTMRMLVRYIQYSHQFAAIESLSVNSWMRLSWKDEFLVWKPEDFGGIKETTLSGSKIWTPDLSVHNSENSWSGSVGSKPCSVDSDGTVICIPQLTHWAMCDMNYKNWPNDRQVCTVRYGTWMHSGEQVNYLLHSKPVVLDQYQENKYWDLISVNATRNPGKYSSVNDTYPTISYTFVMQRHMATLSIRLWTPILAMMSMTAVALCLSVESIERGVLMFFNVACHFVFTASSEYYLPSSGGTVPSLLAYYRDTTIIACAILFETVLLRNLVTYTTQSPNWVIGLMAVAKTGAGKIVFHEFDPSSDVNKVEDVESLTPENAKKSSNADWRRFAMFINRLFTIVVVLAYVIFIIKYLF